MKTNVGLGVGMIQGCLSNSYDLANSYGFSGKSLNLFFVIFFLFYRSPLRKVKSNLEK